ncbi:Hypothetical protein SRAE_1000054600 [Strongyloides ratti]|uniref:Uncharacterized protein n=1 Tax=Strongyloides ratti TaxID=34506 RepID=A0A090MUK7_STRRB|nr:Hypothetical protein SRAE_1000054600 [Strongyloides ratti]CEF62273.1 Hypothetical protein SRAE_1000054600 [Strongyloides ratti]
MAPPSDRGEVSNYNDNVDTLVDEELLFDVNKGNIIIGPLAGTDIVDYVRMENYNDITNYEDSYIAINYLYIALNVSLLLLIFTTLVIIINSMCTLKLLKRKMKRRIEKSKNGNNKENYKDEKYKEIENDLINLKKCLHKRRKIFLRKSLKGKSLENRQNIIEMDEKKMAEIIHTLAKKPKQDEGYFIPKEAKGNDIIMIGEDENILILDKNNNLRKK